MTIREAAALLDAEILQHDFEDRELAGAYTSDLLSDVMAHAQRGDLLITIQAHRNTVAVASMAALPAVLLAGGRPVPADMLEAARSQGIALLRSAENQFILSGKLYPLLGPQGAPR